MKKNITTINTSFTLKFYVSWEKYGKSRGSWSCDRCPNIKKKQPTTTTLTLPSDMKNFCRSGLFISSNFNRTGTVTVSILETRQTFIRNSGPVSYFSICFSENCELSRPQLTLYITTDVDEERKIFFEISPEQGPDSCSSVYWETISLPICVTLSVLTLFVIMILLSWFNKSVLFSHYKP